MPEITNANEIVQATIAGTPRGITMQEAYAMVRDSLRKRREDLRKQEADVTSALVQVEAILSAMKPEA